MVSLELQFLLVKLFLRKIILKLSKLSTDLKLKIDLRGYYTENGVEKAVSNKAYPCIPFPV